MAATEATHDAAVRGPSRTWTTTGTAAAAGHDAHAQEPLGPVDWAAWGAGLLGAAAAGIIAVALYLAANAGT